MNEFTIAEDSPDAWENYYDQVADFVPDPMILRAADVFLMGRTQAGDRTDAIWAALAKNVHGILTFFDALVTRDHIPFINYWQTFSLFVLENVLEDLAVRVDVRNPVYNGIRKRALDRLRELQIEQIPVAEIEDIEQELGAFDYDWEPDLGDLAIPETHVRTARFLLGGLIFGTYALASKSDHLMQAKRSRLFVALSAPEDEHRTWRYEKEQELFDSLRRACLTGQHVRAQDYPAAPSVLPYLMSTEPRPSNPRELLDKALTFRDQGGGKAYREWYTMLRETWAAGLHDPKAQADVEQVRQELERRYGIYQGHPSMTRFDIGFDIKPGGVGAGVTAKDVTLELPQWIRRWFVENVRLKRHGKVLLRLSYAQHNYQNLVMGLKNLWDAA